MLLSLLKAIVSNLENAIKCTYTARMDMSTLLAHFRTKTAIAQFFGITPAAVAQWGDRIPPLRVYELRERKPELFKESAPTAEAAP